MMIAKNLGNAERLFRLLAGAGLFVWFAAQPDVNGMELFVAVVSLCLVLNGIFSRCYLWYVLDLDTRHGPGEGRSRECM